MLYSKINPSHHLSHNLDPEWKMLLDIVLQKKTFVGILTMMILKFRRFNKYDKLNKMLLNFHFF